VATDGTGKANCENHVIKWEGILWKIMTLRILAHDLVPTVDYLFVHVEVKIR
jgi:hypothetical protein